MPPPDLTSAAHRLDAALDAVAAAFRGMTAHPDEDNCTCHWGSAEELALLKVPDVELAPDLLHRTYQSDWRYPASVMRRILPQFSRALVDGVVRPLLGWGELGEQMARGCRRWSAEQADAVGEFLRAWWVWTLTDPDPAVPVYDVLPLCVEASATLGPWLRTWETVTGPPADARIAEALERWEYDLLTDGLPWRTAEDEEGKCAELAAWLVRHGPARLEARGGSTELLEGLRLLGMPGPDRWTNPGWATYFGS